MNKPILIILTGLPASGKTTFAMKLALHLHQKYGDTATVIDSDRIREEIPALSKEFIPELEPAVRRMTLDRVESALGAGLSVIHDDLNYYRSMRFDLVTCARKLQTPHALIQLATDKEICLKYNKDRGFKVPDDVIIKDSTRFDPPGEDPWDTPIAVLKAPDISDSDIELISENLIKLIDEYKPWTPNEKNTHQLKRVEELDLLCRKVVSELFKNQRPKADGKEISRQRVILLREAEEKELDDDEANSFFKEKLTPLFISK